MAKNIKTHLFILDDYRSFTEVIRKKFNDNLRYSIDSFQNKDDLLKNFISNRQPGSCIIVILGIHDQMATADQLISEIRKEDHQAGIILLCPPDKMDEIRKNINFNVDSYIPHNGNAVLRIHNTVKKFFSEYYMKIYRKRRNRSLVVLMAFVVFAGLALFIAFLKFHQYF